MKPFTRNFYEELVSVTVREVRSSLDAILDLPALARRGSLAPLHFHRIFRGMLGETPLEMHRRLRLERAAFTLARSRIAVQRIAFDAGYESNESFTRSFRQVFALSPTKFRMQARTQTVTWSATTKSMLSVASGIHFDTPFEINPTIATEECVMNVIVNNYPPKLVLAVEHRGPYNAVSESFVKLDGLVRAADLPESEDLELVAIFHDDPEITAVADLRAHAGIVVPGKVPAIRGLSRVSLPEGTYAVATHVGPYETLGDSWSRLMGQWLPKSGYRVGAGPSYERYLNTPGNAPADQLRTELYLPVESPKS
jgi:AraC family transcriptional regulator